MASMEEFDNMRVKELKDFLSVRGLSTSGKKKVELVALAYSCVVLGIEIQATQVDLARELRSDYDASLSKSGLSLDPSAVQRSDKVDNVMWWPKINLGNIFEYILGLRDFNKEYIGKYKNQKACSYWGDGHVADILCYRGQGVPDETVLLFAMYGSWRKQTEGKF